MPNGTTQNGGFVKPPGAAEAEQLAANVAQIADRLRLNLVQLNAYLGGGGGFTVDDVALLTGKVLSDYRELKELTGDPGDPALEQQLAEMESAAINQADQPIQPMYPEVLLLDYLILRGMGKFAPIAAGWLGRVLAGSAAKVAVESGLARVLPSVARGVIGTGEAAGKAVGGLGLFVGVPAILAPFGIRIPGMGYLAPAAMTGLAAFQSAFGQESFADEFTAHMFDKFAPPGMIDRVPTTTSADFLKAVGFQTGNAYADWFAALATDLVFLAVAGKASAFGRSLVPAIQARLAPLTTEARNQLYNAAEAMWERYQAYKALPLRERARGSVSFEPLRKRTPRKYMSVDDWLTHMAAVARAKPELQPLTVGGVARPSPLPRTEVKPSIRLPVSPTVAQPKAPLKITREPLPSEKAQTPEELAEARFQERLAKLDPNSPEAKAMREFLMPPEKPPEIPPAAKKEVAIVRRIFDEGILGANEAIRIIQSTLDLSAFRQAAFRTIAHPVKGGAKVWPMLQAFASEAKAADMERGISSRPNGEQPFTKFLRGKGVSRAEFDKMDKQAQGSLTFEALDQFLRGKGTSLDDWDGMSKEERAPLSSEFNTVAGPEAQSFYERGRLSLALPAEQFRQQRWLGAQVMKIPGVKASERAFTTLLNLFRVEMFDEAVARIRLREGREPTETELQAIGTGVNEMTGRGTLGPFESRAASEMLWSPSLTGARFQVLFGHPLYGGTAATRSYFAWEYARFLINVAILYAAGRAAGATIEHDPRSSDFLKLRLGNTRLDLLGGLIQATVFASRMITGKAKSAAGEIVPLRGVERAFASDIESTAARYVRSKLSPGAGVLAEFLTGESYMGKHRTPTEILVSLPVPLSWSDIGNAMMDHGVPAGTALGVLALFGAGLQTYESQAAPQPTAPVKTELARLEAISPRAQMTETQKALEKAAREAKTRIAQSYLERLFATDYYQALTDADKARVADDMQREPGDPWSVVSRVISRSQVVADFYKELSKERKASPKVKTPRRIALERAMVQIDQIRKQQEGVRATKLPTKDTVGQLLKLRDLAEQAAQAALAGQAPSIPTTAARYAPPTQTVIRTGEAIKLPK